MGWVLWVFLSNQEPEVVHVLQGDAGASCYGEQWLVCHMERNRDFVCESFSESS